MIIGIVGHKLSGKGTAATYIAEQYNAQHVVMSSIIKAMLDLLRLEGARSHIASLITLLRERMGVNVLARASYAHVDPQATIAVIDGIRYSEEIAFLRKQDRRFILIYIEASPRIRWERAKARGEKTGEADMSFEAFLEEQNTLNTEAHIDDLGELADVRIVNNFTTVEQLHRALDEALGTHNVAA